MTTKTSNGRAAAAVAKQPSEFERFMALTDSERTAEMAIYDAGPVPFSETRPLTPAERRDWKRWQAKAQANHAARQAASAKPASKPARPAASVAVRAVTRSLDKALLAEADAYAKAHGMDRTALITLGLRLAMARG